MWAGAVRRVDLIKEHDAQHTPLMSKILIFNALQKSFMSKDVRITPTRPTLQLFMGLPDELINLFIFSRHLQPTTQ